MVNPQKENGYTPISNELLEAIYGFPFNATQIKIVLAICRYTYGFSRKEHSLSESFISNAIKISKRYVSGELAKLVEQKIIKIVKNHTDTTPKILALNKHYNEWGSRTIIPQANNNSTGEQLINTTVEELFHTPVEELFHQDKQSLKQNIKQYTREFEKFYAEYPRPFNKEQTYKNWKTTLKKDTSDNILLATTKYIDYLKNNNKNNKEYFLKSTNFVGQHQEYKGYLEMTETKKDIFESGVMLPGGGVML